MAARTTSPTIDARTLKAKLAEQGGNLELLDVRTPAEFAGEHIEGSFNIPLDELSLRRAEIDADKALILICRTGKRAASACAQLTSSGLNATVLEGGVVGWRSSGFDLITGKQVLPLDRQVQLTIGLILLASTAAGFTVSRWFFVLPALIGAGLTFAGLTGSCGLALLLAKAPWNRTPGISCGSSCGTSQSGERPGSSCSF